ncbi:hypothetical protein OAA64_01805 [bacterium]|nr:hypothetical protein [bacterium]
MIEIVIGIAVILFTRNRIKHALYQRQKEDFWREVIKKVEQKKKLDELYGRNQDR